MTRTLWLAAPSTHFRSQPKSAL